MIEQDIPLKNSTARGFVIPLGPVSLVAVVAKSGLAGCGAFDVAALDTFGYPAARVRGAEGRPIATLQDLLAGIVREVNSAGGRFGIAEGMTGKEALDLLS